MAGRGSGLSNRVGRRRRSRILLQPTKIRIPRPIPIRVLPAALLLSIRVASSRILRLLETFT